MTIPTVSPEVTPGMAIAGFVGALVGWVAVSWQMARLKRGGRS